MILCCGEALIDMVPVDGAFAPLPGGAIFNTAIALGRLDTPVQFFSGVSSDLFGVQLAEALEASGVGTGLLARADRPTTLAFVKLIAGQAQYTFYDENSAGRMLSVDDLPDVGAETRALYFGGISLCAEPAATAYETLCLREAATKVVMLDPNIRPSFITDADAYRARLTRMMAAADIVKVSDEDLDWILPDMPEAAQVAHLHGLGTKLVIVTKGAEGATGYTASETVHVRAPKVQVVDTVGAGDTFNAGFLAELHARDLLGKSAVAGLNADDLKAALNHAAAVAAVTVTRQGANPPYASEL